MFVTVCSSVFPPGLGYIDTRSEYDVTSGLADLLFNDDCCRLLTIKMPREACYLVRALEGANGPVGFCLETTGSVTLPNSGLYPPRVFAHTLLHS